MGARWGRARQLTPCRFVTRRGIFGHPLRLELHFRTLIAVQKFPVQAENTYHEEVPAMADKSSLLSYIARRHTVGREDVATSALSFILSHSNSARQALSEFISQGGPPLQVAQAKSWGADALRASPDLACYDENGDLVALIESKFWAPLTHHQPVTYWEGLPYDRPAVLLFLAPACRVKSGELWHELVGRLDRAGHNLGPEERIESLVTASAKKGRHRLVLTSWDLLLGRLEERAKDDCDHQSSFEIAELQGLATDVTAAENPRHDENLKKLIADAVKRVEQSSWANTDGLRVGQGFEYYGRFLRLAGLTAWLGIDYQAIKQVPGKPVWLAFYHLPKDVITQESMRSRLGDLAEPGFVWGSEYTCVPIALPDGVDTEATCHAIVAQLERIAKLIDPDGPTYRETH